jgi:O-antigen/teichoic acid export membrane protein
MRQTPGAASGEVQSLMTDNVPYKALRNTLYNAVRQGIVMLSAVCTSILVARTLGPANMGVYGLTVWLVGVLGIFANLGLPGAATKYIAEYLGRGDRQTASHVSRRLLLAQVVLAAGAAGGTAIVGMTLAGRYRQLLLIGAALVMAKAMQQALSASLAGVQRYDRIAAMSFWVAIGEIVIVSLAARRHCGTVGMLEAVLVGDSLGLAFGLFVVRRTILWPPFSSPPAGMEQTLRRVRKYSLTVSYILLLNAIVWERSEVLFLKGFSTLSQIGFYSIAFALAGKLSEMATVCTSTLMPLSSEAYGRSGLQELRAVYYSGMKYIQMLIVPLAMFGADLSGAAVRLLYGEKFLPLVPVLQILLAGVAVATLGGVASSLIYALDKQPFMAKFGTAVAVLNILLDLLLIPRWGAMGAAIANSSAQVLAVLIGLVYAKSLLACAFPWKETLKIYTAAAVSATPAFFLAQEQSGQAALLAATALGVVCYLSLLIILGAIGKDGLALIKETFYRFSQRPAIGL